LIMNGPTTLPEVIIIEPKVFSDPRGWFQETYSLRDFKKLGIDTTFVQDNHSYSERKGVLRGMHYQAAPFEQAKLVRCTRGSILDVVVDLREGSPRFGRWMSLVLSAENRRQLFVPKGFAHGFLTLEDGCEVQYKVDGYFNAENERTIRYDDPDIGIEWGIDEPILSEKDRKAPYLRERFASLAKEDHQ